MMKKLIVLLTLGCLFFPAITFARVLFIVESAYYNDSLGNIKLNRYAQEVRTIDGKQVEVIEFTHPGTGTTRELCKPVWDILIREYVENLADTVEGAVLIGNVPEPMFLSVIIKDIKNPYDTSITIRIHGGVELPVDYYYMDLKDSRFGADTLWKSDLDVWNYPITRSWRVPSPPLWQWERSISYDSLNDLQQFQTLPDTFYSFEGWGLEWGYKGDNNPEIWVSRIYSKSILHYPRDTGFAVWDTGGFFEENEIISMYLDKVHDWMTGRAPVPASAIGMGHIQHYYTNAEALENLKCYIGFDSLDVIFRRYFIHPESNTPNWQSQLQAGPYGNINAGAFMGMKNDISNAIDNRYQDKFYSWDTRGFMWAGVVEHGHREGHTFNAAACISRNGNFDAKNNIPLWTKFQTGGYNGSYYASWNRQKYLRDGECFEAFWYCDLDTADTGWYSFQIYYVPELANCDSSFLNIIIDNSIIKDGWLNQRIAYDSINDNWQTRFDSLVISSSHFHSNMSHRIYIHFAAHFLSRDTVNDRAIADAIKIVNLKTGKTFLVDNEDTNFYYSNYNNRHLYSMPDDGGPSKTKFFIHNVCDLNLYTLTDRVGLLYAMCHGGLISFGTTLTNYGSTDNKPLLRIVQNGGCFGDGLLEMAKSARFKLAGDPRFSLLGAGTLKAYPYKPYIDYDTLLITNKDLTKIETYWVKDKVEIKDSVNILNGAALNIVAGNWIVIRPEFHAEKGSEMHLKIDRKLKD